MILTYYFTKRIKWDILSIWIVSCIGALIVYLAPGNDIRIANFPTSQKVLAFAEAFAYSGFLFWKWILIPPIPIGLFLLLHHLPSKSFILNKLEHIPPTIFWLGFCLVFYLGTFVGFWSLGFRPPTRTLNVIYLSFLIGFFFNCYLTLHYYRKRIAFTKSSLIQYSLLTLTLYGYLFSSFNHVIPVYEQLFSGKLKRFDQHMQIRYNLIQTSNQPNLILPRIEETQDNIIFNTDITIDSTNWINTSYAEYFGKKSIRIEKQIP